jgi:hypothetical protein
MTSNELRSIAERSGLIQWRRSGVVEHVYIGRSTKRIYAQNLVTLHFHTLRGSHADWHCREVSPNDLIRLSALLPKTRMLIQSTVL